METPRILVEGLSVAYNQNIALRDAGLRLGAGTICGLVGMNGSGKSTLFKAIMGFVSPQRGRVLIDGEPARRAQRRGLVAYVPQSEEVDWNFPVSVSDVAMMGRYGHMSLLRIPRPADREIVNVSLERVQMGEFRARQIGELSGGQRKRAFLARALAQQGSIMLLDEPFTGVDQTTIKAITALLLELRGEGHTILISTHDLQSVATFCDQVALVNRTVLAYGPTSEVFTPENLGRTFGGFVPPGDRTPVSAVVGSSREAPLLRRSAANSD